jgi:AcrR family transcriptional regulator
MAKSRQTKKARPGGPVVTGPIEPTVTLAIQDPRASAGAGPALAGRRAEAARNDRTILEAARSVFLADPKAPVSAVAKTAGVGISALYRRWPAKEDLLRQLCSDGLDRFIAEAETAALTEDGWAALADFLRRVVAADVHSLTVHLAGTFTPTTEMGEAANRANELAAALVRRAHKSGRLRRDVVVEDLTMLLEGCAAVRVPDPVRTAELRQRYLELQLDGLSADNRSQLPGPPPSGDELNWRWHRAG